MKPIVLYVEDGQGMVRTSPPQRPATSYEAQRGFFIGAATVPGISKPKPIAGKSSVEFATQSGAIAGDRRRHSSELFTRRASFTAHGVA